MAVSGYIPRIRLTLEGGRSAQEFREGSEGALRIQILDQDGVATGDADVTAVAWTLFDVSTMGIINTRSAVAGSAVDDQRTPLLAADNVIVSGSLAENGTELHRLRVAVTFVSGINDLDAAAIDTAIEEIDFYVRKNRTVT